jgi:selenide,water dikinase
MGPGTLEEILKDFVFPTDPNLLVGLDTRDDAGVYKINDEIAVIQTLDFFTPMVDDPFVFGQIAATNAINDIYAMGGKPLLAMNIVCFPDCGDLGLLKQILAGGLDKIKEAEALLIGGHTVDDNEPKYGLAVCGIIHPDKIISNSGARKDDILLLTKPLGNGIISTGIKAELASEDVYSEATHWMSMLNKNACSVMQKIGVHGATDVTGFGFLGHLFELAEASDVSVEVVADQVPFMTGTLEYAQMGLIPGGAYKNREYLNEKVLFSPDVNQEIRDVLFSPETAGGILMSVDQDKLPQIIDSLQQEGCFFSIVGRVLHKGFQPIRVIRSDRS